MENLCKIPFDAEVFALDGHPTLPLMTVGLANGRMECYRLPSLDKADGDSGIKPLWSTRRHKGSCRCVAYCPKGENMFSAGSDGIVKQFVAQSGKVFSKIKIRPRNDGEVDPPAIMKCLSPTTLLLGTDDGFLYIYDVRENDSQLNTKPVRTHRPHTDYVTSISPLAPIEADGNFPKQWVSTGANTLAVTDVRYGLITHSEPQHEGLLCSAVIPTGLGPKNLRSNPVVAVGTTDSVITMWDKGSWDDQQERVYVGDERKRKEAESLDAIMHVPDSVSWSNGKTVVVGASDGTLSIMDLHLRESLQVMKHDEVEGVTSLDLDKYGRILSAAGKTVAIWQDNSDISGNGRGADDDDDGKDSDDDSDSDSGGAGAGASKKRAAKSTGSDDSDDSDSDDSDSKKIKRRSKKKRRKGKGKKARGPSQSRVSFPGLD